MQSDSKQREIRENVSHSGTDFFQNADAVENAIREQLSIACDARNKLIRRYKRAYDEKDERFFAQNGIEPPHGSKSIFSGGIDFQIPPPWTRTTLSYTFSEITAPKNIPCGWLKIIGSLSDGESAKKFYNQNGPYEKFLRALSEVEDFIINQDHFRGAYNNIARRRIDNAGVSTPAELAMRTD